jgi:hypothetical protein
VSNYVYDATALPDGKVDAATLSVPASQGITAAEWNTVMAAIDDIQGVLLGGKFVRTLFSPANPVTLDEESFVDLSSMSAVTLPVGATAGRFVYLDVRNTGSSITTQGGQTLVDHAGTSLTVPYALRWESFYTAVYAGANVWRLLRFSTLPCGDPPTVSAGTGAGPNATVGAGGSDTSGTIYITTDAADTPAANADIVTVTFASVKGTSPSFVVAPANDAAWDLASGVVRYRQADTTSALFKLRSGATPLPALTAATYAFNYFSEP